MPKSKYDKVDVLISQFIIVKYLYAKAFLTNQKKKLMRQHKWRLRNGK